MDESLNYITKPVYVKDATNEWMNRWIVELESGEEAEVILTELSLQEEK